MIDFVIAVTVLSAVAPGAGSCVPVMAEPISSRVDSILASKDVPERSAQIGELAGYWRGHCAASRRTADREVVVSLARLLSDPLARLVASSMLLDIGPNLRFARSALTRALAQQEAREKAQARAAEPFVPTTKNQVSVSLRCVLTKLRSGAVDAKLCRYIKRLSD